MRLTEHMIIARSKESDLSTIKRINLWGCDLSDIAVLEKMTNIETLALSVNNVSSLKPLRACAKLQVLYLRKNNIETFKELKHLQNLTELTQLWLAENPCAVRAGPSYRACVLKMLPNLKKLDDTEITAEELEQSKTINISEYDVPPSEGLSQKRENDLALLSLIDQVSLSQESLPPINEIEDACTLQPLDIQQSQHEEQAVSSQEINGAQKQQQMQAQLELQQKMQSSSQTQSARPQMQQQLQQTQSTPSFQVVHDMETQRSRQSLPMNCALRADEQQSKDRQLLNKAQSLGQLPQLKLYLQIHPAQGSVEQPVNVEYPDSTGKDAKSLRLEEGSQTARTSISQGCGAHTSRSGQTNNNLSWEDGLQTGRTTNFVHGSSSTYTLSAAKKSRRNAKLLSALLCIVPELDVDSLQVLQHSITCRIDELGGQ